MQRRELLKGLLGSLISGQVLPQAIAKTAPVVSPVTETLAAAVAPSSSFMGYNHAFLADSLMQEFMQAEDEKFLQTVFAELDTPTETLTTGTLIYGTGTDIKKLLAVEF